MSPASKETAGAPLNSKLPVATTEGSNGSTSTAGSSAQSLTRDSSIFEIGADETLWNPDKTRYGGYLIPPKEVLRPETTSDSEFRRILEDWVTKQDSPLTPDEQAQSDRWLKAAGGRHNTPLDPALVDEAIEYLEG